MKNSKKTWGMLGTSMGSMLIIVALLTMVGMGSNDTYAAEECVCGAGQTKRGLDCFDASNKWVGTCKTSSSSSSSSSSKPSSSKPSSSTASVTCSAGTYYTGATKKCEPCLSGYYCPGTSLPSNTTLQGTDGLFKCPTGTTSSAGASSESDCKSSGTVNSCANLSIGATCTTSDGKNGTCIDSGSSSGGRVCKANSSGTVNSCANLSIGATCTTSDGKNGTCIDSGSSSGGRVCKANSSGSDTNYVHCDKGWFYTGDGKTCTKCPSGSWCPGGNFLASSLVRDGGVKCPDDRPYSEPGSYQVSDCKASGSGGTGGNGGNGGTGGNGGNTGGNTGGNGNNGGSGTTGGNNGNNSNTNTNPGTATKTPLVIVVIGMIAMGLGTFTYYKSKNNEI